MRTPSSRSEDITCDREAVLAIFRQIAKDGRRMLTETEAKAVISAYSIPAPETIVAKSPAEAEVAAGRLLKTSEQVVVKLVSKAISHKSDIGGVVLNIADAAAAGKAARSIQARVRKHAPKPILKAMPFSRWWCENTRRNYPGHEPGSDLRPHSHVRRRRHRGRVMDDTAIAFPPLDDILAGDLIDQRGSAAC